MYDTINFRLTAEDVCNINFLEETPCYLNNIANHIFSGVPVVTGDLGGLKVVASLTALLPTPTPPTERVLL